MDYLRMWVLTISVLWPLQPLLSQERATSSRDTTRTPTTSWSHTLVLGKELLGLPGRTNQYYLPLVAGVVEFNGGLYVRGSRSYENVYTLEGFNTTNPVFNTNGFELIPEATEAMDIHTGAVGAGYFSANGALVTSRMRRGGETLEAFGEYRTDDLTGNGRSIFGMTPLGMNTIVATIGGPALEGIRFFAAGQYHHVRNRQAIYLEPFRYEGLTDDGFQSGYLRVGSLLIAPDSVDQGIMEITRNYLDKNWSQSYDINGNVLVDFNRFAAVPLTVHILGIHSFSRQPTGGDWPYTLYNYYRREERLEHHESTSSMIAGRLKHILDTSTQYEIGIDYQYRFSETYDPNYGRSTFVEMLETADSAAAAARGFNTSGWRDRYFGPLAQSTIFGFRLAHPEEPNNTYMKEQQSALGLTVDVSSEVSANWTINVGGRLDRWTFRQYSFGNIRNLLSYRDPNRDGDVSDEPTYANEYEKRVRYIDRGNIVSWGYTYLGDESDGYSLDGNDAALDAPYEPTFGSMYAEAAFHNESTVMRLGLRYEFIDPAIKTLQNLYGAEAPDFENPPYDYRLGIIDESKITSTKAFHLFLPRVSLSVEAGGGAHLYAGFGQYAQMPPYELLMQSNFRFSQAVSPPDRSPYSFGTVGYVPAFPVKPERTTHFEGGATIDLLPNMTIGGVLYYKAMKDQLQFGRYYDQRGTWIFTVRANEGYGSAKGAELSFELHRTGGLAILLNYALSATSGLSSNPKSNVVQVTDAFDIDTLLVERPLDYQQTHRATLVFDFKTQREAGTLWGDLGATAVVRFNSGHRYTKSGPITSSGSFSPWQVGVRMLVDPRTANWVEPTNSSETPNSLIVDVRLSKGFSIGPMRAELYFVLLNAFDTKSVVNVYPSTGTATSDGWYRTSPYYFSYEEYDQLFTPFYHSINIDNRWAYTGATGYDIYGAPRQFRLGLSVQY